MNTSQSRKSVEIRVPNALGVALASALLAAALASGCSVLGQAAPDRARYFVLTSTEASAAQPPQRAQADVHFGLGPVKLPGYLDSQSLVSTGANGSVSYVPDAYWAEPLAPGFARALLYRTGARIGTTHGVAYPWYSTARVDWKVPVDMLRFEATSDGRVALVARWSVQRTKDSVTVAGGESTFEEDAGSGPDEIVAALSRCIDRLAEAIAAGVSSSTAAAAPAAAPSKPRKPAAR